MDPDELCKCGHERKWHDACSLCDCPWFLSPTNKGAVKRWTADRRLERRLRAAAKER